MSIHEFMSQTEGLSEDPNIDLSKPTQTRKKQSRSEHQKRASERTRQNKNRDLSQPIGREDDFGDREYKLKLTELTRERRNELITQMNFRLNEGKGKCFYMIGFTDEGIPEGIPKESMDESIKNLESMAEDILALAVVSQKRRTPEKKFVAEIMVTRKERNEVILDIRVILLGSEGSGKSTLIGILTHGQRDNGKGLARGNIFQNLNEMRTGKTLSVSQHILGFNDRGDITNFSLGFRNTFDNIIDKSAKIVSLIDIAGSERHAKSLITGMCSHLPDYAILVIDAVRGFQSITYNHLELAIAMSLPLVIVITKIDKASPLELSSLLDQIKLPQGKLKLEIENRQDVMMVSNLFLSEEIVPVFKISSVTFESVDCLISFLNLLPIRQDWDHTKEKLFFIEKIIEKPEVVGKIVGGPLMKGTVHTGQRMWLGPDNQGNFNQVTITNIHCKMVPVRTAKAGQYCSFLLGEVSNLRSGMVLLDIQCQPRACMEFLCEIRTVDSKSDVRTLPKNYRPLVYTQTIRQCAEVLFSGTSEIEPGVNLNLRLRFMYRPEYLVIGTKVMIKDDFMTAIGVITDVEEHAEGLG